MGVLRSVYTKAVSAASSAAAIVTGAIVSRVMGSDESSSPFFSKYINYLPIGLAGDPFNPTGQGQLAVFNASDIDFNCRNSTLFAQGTAAIMEALNSGLCGVAYDFQGLTRTGVDALSGVTPLRYSSTGEVYVTTQTSPYDDHSGYGVVVAALSNAGQLSHSFINCFVNLVNDKMKEFNDSVGDAPCNKKPEDLTWLWALLGVFGGLGLAAGYTIHWCNRRPEEQRAPLLGAGHAGGAPPQPAELIAGPGPGLYGPPGGPAPGAGAALPGGAPAAAGPGPQLSDEESDEEYESEEDVERGSSTPGAGPGPAPGLAAPSKASAAPAAPAAPAAAPDSLDQGKVESEDDAAGYDVEDGRRSPSSNGGKYYSF